MGAAQIITNLVRWLLIIYVISGFMTAAICLWLKEFGHDDWDE